MDCVFCKIVNREIPSTIRYEDSEIIAFNDLAPHAPVHILIIPKKHYDSIAKLDDYDLPGKMMKVAQKLAKELGLEENGFRLVINTGDDAGQTVHHLHMHLLGGKQLGLTLG